MNFSNLISVIKIRKKNKDECKEQNGIKKEVSDNDDFFPYRIFDIKKSKKLNLFKFKVDFVGLKTRIKKRKWVKNLDKYSKKSEKNLLIKFYKDLKEIIKDDELQPFAQERLTTFYLFLKMKKYLKTDFCKLIDNNIESKICKKKKKRKKKNKITSSNSIDEKDKLKKQINFIRINVLEQIQKIQLILKEKKKIKKDKFFHYLDHITNHNLHLYNQEFNV